jgi:hypothetical protein
MPAGAANAQHRFDASASVALTETYDDNVFMLPTNARQDMVSRLTPRLGVAYLAPRFDLRARYTRDAERFSRNRELSTLRARQQADLDLRWSPGGGFEAEGSATYAETHSPGEFTVITGLDVEGRDLTGLELRRAPASRFSTTGSLSYRMGARTRAVVAHGFTQDEIVGGPTSVTHVAAASLERQIGPVDTLGLAYGLRQFTALGDRSRSHAVTFKWAREVSRQAHIELRAGPRLSGGTVAPELEATLRHRFRRGDAAVSYVQTETAIIGRPKPLTAEGLSATFNRVLSRTLRVEAGPSVLRARGEAVEATVYGTRLELMWRLNRRLSLGVSHQLSVQHGRLDGLDRGEIVHNTALLRLVAGATP